MANFYLRTATVAGLALLASLNIQAKDIFVSANGSDANNGLSADAALASLKEAAKLAESGDVINVSGTVKLTEVAELTDVQNVTIKGSDSDYSKTVLNGGNKTQILKITSSTVTIQDITFRNAYIETNDDTYARGAAINASASTLNIDNVYFRGNKTSMAVEANGGAIYANNQSVLNITNSNFSQNESARGGAMEIDQSTAIIQSTIFSKNYAGSSIEGKTGNGGAAMFNKSDIDLKYCTFENNSASGYSGAFSLSNNAATTGKHLNVVGCAFVGNQALGGPGGAARLQANADYKINFISSTFVNNETTQAGAAFSLDGTGTEDQEVNIINCTITGNVTSNNAGNAAVVTAFQPHTKVKIVNTIIEGNRSGQQHQWADARFVREQSGTDGSTVTVINSIVGFVNDALPQNVENSTFGACGNRSALTAGLVTEELQDGEYTLAKPVVTNNCVALTEGALATTMGSVEVAKANGSEADQFGTEWTLPYIGAVQLLQGAEVPDVPTTAIQGVKTVENTVAPDAWYNLQGVRVAAPQKGIYIHNGKKVVLK